jgi:hypothetical protein
MNLFSFRLVETNTLSYFLQHTEKIRTMADVQAGHDSLVSVEEALFGGGCLYQVQQSRLHMRFD